MLQIELYFSKQYCFDWSFQKHWNWAFSWRLTMRKSEMLNINIEKTRFYEGDLVQNTCVHRKTETESPLITRLSDQFRVPEPLKIDSFRNRVQTHSRRIARGWRALTCFLKSEKQKRLRAFTRENGHKISEFKKNKTWLRPFTHIANFINSSLFFFQTAAEL